MRMWLAMFVLFCGTLLASGASAYTASSSSRNNRPVRTMRYGNRGAGHPQTVQAQPSQTARSPERTQPSSIAAAEAPSTAAGSALRWDVRVELGTDFPVSAGGRLVLQTPWLLRLTTTVGTMPGPYVSGINSLLMSAGAYSEDTARLVSQAFDRTFMWRIQLGLKPVPSSGFYFEAGYMIGEMRGATTADAVMNAELDQAPAYDADRDMSGRIGVATRLHIATVELGWQWTWFDHWSFRVALGGAFTCASSTTLTPDHEPSAEEAKILSAAEGGLDSTLTSYGFTPVFSTYMGYAF